MISNCLGYSAKTFYFFFCKHVYFLCSLTVKEWLKIFIVHNFHNNIFQFFFTLLHVNLFSSSTCMQYLPRLAANNLSFVLGFWYDQCFTYIHFLIDLLCTNGKDSVTDSGELGRRFTLLLFNVKYILFFKTRQPFFNVIRYISLEIFPR